MNGMIFTGAFEYSVFVFPVINYLHFELIEWFNQASAKEINKKNVKVLFYLLFSTIFQYKTLSVCRFFYVFSSVKQNCTNIADVKLEKMFAFIKENTQCTHTVQPTVLSCSNTFFFSSRWILGFESDSASLHKYRTHLIPPLSKSKKKWE